MGIVDISTEAFASLSTLDRLQVLWNKGLIRDFAPDPECDHAGERAYTVWLKEETDEAL